MSEPNDSQEPAAAQGNARVTWVSVVVVVACLAHWVALWWYLAPLEWIPHWFWERTWGTRPHWWIAFPLVGLHLGVLALVWRWPTPRWRNVLLVAGLGLATQFGFALMEARGLDALRERMVTTGHAKFVQAAAGGTSFLRVAGNYQHLIEEGQLPRIALATKPPGMLLFYMITERAARVACPWIEEPRGRVIAFATIAYPLLACLAVIPICGLSRLCLSGPMAYVPAILYVACPNVALIALHLDQCLFPLLFTSALLCFVRGVIGQRTVLLILSGLLAGLSVYITFSLAMLVPFFVVVACLAVVKEGSGGIGRGARSLATAAAGAALWFGVVYALTGYDPVTNYRYAMAQHEGWRGIEWTLGTTAYLAALGVFEFALWLGIPVFVAAAARSGQGLDARPATMARPGDVLALALWGAVLLAAFMGRAVGETARLWLFLTPLFALAAAEWLAGAFGRLRVWAVAAVVLLQLGTTFMIKLFQDFA